MDQNTQSTGQQQQRQQPVYDPNNNGGHYGTIPFFVHVSDKIANHTIATFNNHLRRPIQLMLDFSRRCKRVCMLLLRAADFHHSFKVRSFPRKARYKNCSHQHGLMYAVYSWRQLFQESRALTNNRRSTKACKASIGISLPPTGNRPSTIWRPRLMITRSTNSH